MLINNSSLLKRVFAGAHGNCQSIKANSRASLAGVLQGLLTFLPLEVTPRGWFTVNKKSECVMQQSSRGARSLGRRIVIIIMTCLCLLHDESLSYRPPAASTACLALPESITCPQVSLISFLQRVAYVRPLLDVSRKPFCYLTDQSNSTT